jgi:hypothetical protein
LQSLRPVRRVAELGSLGRFTHMKWSITLLLAGVALVGCRTTPSLRSNTEYRVQLTNGYTALIELRDDVLNVHIKNGKDWIAEFIVDPNGDDIRLQQTLGYRRDITDEKRDSGLGSSIGITTHRGKVTRHYIEQFDGNVQRYLYDRDNDFFPDERVSIGIGDGFKFVPGTRKREKITYEFTPYEKANAK